MADCICEKQRCCELLGQCIYTLKGVQDNYDVIEALKRIRSQKKINAILAIAIPEKAPKQKPKKGVKKKKPAAKIRPGYPFRKSWLKYMENKIA